MLSAKSLSGRIKIIIKRSNLLILFAVASTMLFLKLLLSYYAYGTNDIANFIKFAGIINKYGAFKIYALDATYNHSPLISYFLKAISFLSIKTSLSFQFLFRLLPILADYAAIFVLWGLLNKYGRENRLLICLLFAFSPINIIISAFHGNTDTVFVFFILFAVYLVEQEQFSLAGLFYGLSICIKIVPLMLLPVFFFNLESGKDRIKFTLSASILPLLVFTPLMIYDFSGLLRNIWMYGGNEGIWGLGYIFDSIAQSKHLNAHITNIFFNAHVWHIVLSKIILYAGIVIFSLLFMRKKKISLIEGVCFVFLFFFTITSGFGVQYLSWLSLFAVTVFPLLGSLYLLLGGIFLYRVNMYWSKGIPPYYANSEAFAPWGRVVSLIGIILWLLIVAMLVKFLIHKTEILRSKKV